MVRCSLKCFALALMLAVIVAQPLTASAVSPYEGNISTTYITIFRDIATKIPLNADYVFFRSGQYDYTMVVGDFDDTGNAITSGSEVTIYTISTNSGYNSIYDYSVSIQTGYTITPGSALIYSNLGNYPDLIERNDNYALATLLLLLVGICCYLCRSIFGFCLRFRSESR